MTTLPNALNSGWLSQFGLECLEFPIVGVFFGGMTGTESDQVESRMMLMPRISLASAGPHSTASFPLLIWIKYCPVGIRSMFTRSGRLLLVGSPDPATNST